MAKKIIDMNQEEMIEHYTNWFFNNSLKDEYDLKNLIKKVLLWGNRNKGECL